jgi:hypothetical protein
VYAFIVFAVRCYTHRSHITTALLIDFTEDGRNSAPVSFHVSSARTSDV